MRKRARTALVALTILLSAASLAAQNEFRVAEVQVEGNRIASESLILGVASLEPGISLTPTVISETIRRLYGLGIFSDVRIEAEPADGGLSVYIVVEELPKLVALEFEGNKKLKSKDLTDKLGLGVGGYISPYLIQKKKAEIDELYAEKGYFQAEIEPILTYTDDSTQARLLYRIAENSKVKVEKVVLSGAQRIDPDDLIGKMRNRKRGFLRSSDFAKDKFDEDMDKVIAECHKRGFIDAYIISDSIDIDTTRNRMTVFLEIYEGPKYYFGEVTFAGNDKWPADALRNMLKFSPGDVFNEEKYERSIDEFNSAYWEIGHLHAQILDQRTTRQDSIVDVSYEINEGLPSHVNMIQIVGNYKTKEKVIRRELSMLPGMIFNQSLLIRSVRDCMALNYFESVLPTPLALPNGDVDLEFKINEKRTGEIMAGAGYNSQDKVVGNVALGIPNFRGEGQRVQFNVDFGQRRNSFSLGFTEPWMFGRPTLLGISLYTTNRRWYEDYTEGRQGGSIRIGRRLRWPDNYFRVYASYLLERNRFFDFDDAFISESSYKSAYWYDARNDSNPYDAQLAERTYGIYPGSIVSYDEEWLAASRVSFTLKRDSRNLPQFATDGSIISYTFEHTGGFLGGFWNYQKHSLELAKFVPLFWKFSLAAKLQYGVVTSPSGDDHILVSDRFTPGGTDFDGIVRGYDGGSLTPDSLVKASDTAFFYYDNDVVVGIDPPDDTLFNVYQTRVRGKYMLVSNLELQFPIAEQQVYGLLFFDAGNSWLHRRDIKPLTGLYKSLGVGFRVVVPGIGTIGFDFGYALDDYRGAGKGWKPHFQIGTTFR
ncbi:MAG: outer membrane protein assembly factor BamA [bacterium]